MSMYDCKSELGYRVGYHMSDEGLEFVSIQVFMAKLWTVREEIDDMIRKPHLYYTPEKNIQRMGYLQRAMSDGFKRIAQFNEPFTVTYQERKMTGESLYQSMRVEPWYQGSIRSMREAANTLDALGFSSRKREDKYLTRKVYDSMEYATDYFVSDGPALMAELDRKAVRIVSHSCIPLLPGQTYNASEEYFQDIGPRPTFRAERIMVEQAIAAR